MRHVRHTAIILCRSHAQVKKVCKVPAKPEDAMKSSLMGMTEKARMAQFTLWVSKCNLAERKT